MVSRCLKRNLLDSFRLFIVHGKCTLLCLRHSSSSFDPYEVLQIGRDANETTIKNAYIKLSKQYHPDRNPGHNKSSEMFIRIQNSYRLIMEQLAEHKDIDEDSTNVKYSFTISPSGIENEHERRFGRIQGNTIGFFASIALCFSVLFAFYLVERKQQVGMTPTKEEELIESYKRHFIHQQNEEIELEARCNDLQKKLERFRIYPGSL